MNTFNVTKQAIFGGGDDEGEKRLSRAERIHRDNERSNLLIISKLVLKAFLEQAMVSRNRIIDCESQQLSDLLMLLEKVLFHGFKAVNTRSFLVMKSRDSELWTALCFLARGEDSMMEAVNCVTHLEELLTPISKVRAFLRVALMQKKIAAFLTHICMSSRIGDYYESWALVRHEDLVQLSGSLLGLSVIDCNIQLNFDNLQEQPLSVDFSQYIKIPTLPMNGVEHETIFDMTLQVVVDEELKIALDQNNFLDERNRYLQNQVDQLKKKVDGFESAKSNVVLMNDVVKFNNVEEKDEHDQTACKKEMQGFRKEIENLHTHMVELEDTITINNQQLDDTKRINVDLYDKLRSSEDMVRKLEQDFVRLKDRSDQEKETLKKNIRTLELQSSTLLEKLTARDGDQDCVRSELEKKCEQYSDVLLKLEEKQTALKHREQELDNHQKEIQKLREEAKEMPNVVEELEELREKYAVTKARSDELEKALEELGGQLSESKLRMIELAEELRPLSDGQWAKDSEVSNCTSCEEKFTLSRRKHHCRMCGAIYCASCSASRVKLPSNPKPARVCEACFAILQNRQI